MIISFYHQSDGLLKICYKRLTGWKHHARSCFARVERIRYHTIQTLQGTSLCRVKWAYWCTLRCIWSRVLLISHLLGRISAVTERYRLFVGQNISLAYPVFFSRIDKPLETWVAVRNKSYRSSFGCGSSIEKQRNLFITKCTRLPRASIALLSRLAQTIGDTLGAIRYRQLHVASVISKQTYSNDYGRGIRSSDGNKH